MIARVAAAAAALLATVACENYKPLVAPLPAESFADRGLRIAVADSDLPQLASTVSALTGKAVELATAPTAILGGDHLLGALAAQLPTGDVSAAWMPNGHLLVTAKAGPAKLPLSVGRAGEPACALTWSIASATAQVEVAAGGQPTGAWQVALAAQPQLQIKQAALGESEGCLQPLPAGAEAFVADQVRQAVAAAWLFRLAGSAVQVVRSVWPADANAGVQAAVGNQAAASFQAQYVPAGAEWVAKSPLYAVADLRLGTAAGRDPCAPDEAMPPGEIAQPLSAAPVPAAKAVLRRALVLHRAAAARIFWAAARAGGFCRASQPLPLAGIAGDWAAAVAPGLAGWTDDSPPRARLWPHASPTIDLIDTSGGPALAWQLQDATIELLGRIGGSEAVVLAVRGRLRGVLRLAANGSGHLTVHFVDGALDSALVSSPIAGGSVAANAKMLDKLVGVALAGMFGPDWVLPLAEALPAGTVVSDVTRSADALWIWMDGGLPKSP